MTTPDPRPLRPFLDSAATVADGASVALATVSQPAAMVARYIAAALRFGGELAAAGVDPLERIMRIHSADPDLQDTEHSWSEALRRRFGASPNPTDAP